MQHFYSKRFVASALALLLVVGPVAASVGARPAHAIFGIGDTTFDIGLNNPLRIAKEAIGFGKQVATAASSALTATGVNSLTAKEYGFDSIAYLAAQTAIHSIVRSTINWINSGFEGSPAFATDLKQNLRRVADSKAQGFLTELLNDSAVHTPFMDKLITNAGAAYYLYSSRDAVKARLQSTLDEHSPNSKAFLAGDFNQGGWNAWFSAFENPANNPYGAQMIASQLLAEEISSGVETRVTELAWGNGWGSFRDCGGALPTYVAPSSGGTTDLNDAEKCPDAPIKTSGSTIKAAFEKSGFVGIDQLVSADEMNEIVGALFGQLMNKMLGGGGVAGLSSPSSGGGSSVISQATDGSGSGSQVTSISSNFRTIVKNQNKQLATYIAALQKTLGAAQAALAKCPSLAATIQPIVTSTSSAIATATDASVALNQILSDIDKANTVTGSEQSDLLLTVSEKYQSLQSSGALPTALEVQEAEGNAEDTGKDGVPVSVYTQMTNYANNGCVSTTSGT